MMKNGRDFRLRNALFPMGYYAANSVYQGYISLYYTQLNFSGGQIGAIGAASAAATLLAQPVWGRIGDIVRRRRLLLCALSLAAALALPAALANGSFTLQMICAMLFYAFFCALLPLGDTILLEAGGFGAYRLAGGISFALASAFFGLLRGRLKPGGTLWCAAALLALTAGAALLLPESSGKGRGRRNMAALLKNRRLMGLLAFTLPLQMTMGFFYTFYAPHFREIGGSDAMLGLGYLLATASEAPYLILSGRIRRRFGTEKPMCIAAGMLAIRWLLLGAANSPWTALLSQLLHGGGFIVITVSMALWISGNVPEELRASGQALLNMCTFGLARIPGNLLGGWVAENWGRGTAFLACAAICAVTGLGMLLQIRRMPPAEP